MAACLDLIFYALFALLFVGSRSLAETTESLLGRWDLTIHGAHGDAPSWIEVSRQGGTLKVLAVGPVGDAAEATQVAITGNSFAFLVLKDPSEGKNTDVQYSATLVGERLEGRLHSTDGASAKWTGVRAPELHASSHTTWATPITLFNGKNLEGWHFSRTQHTNWTVGDGVFSTKEHGADLISDRTFSDFKLHLEFRSGPHSNSGLYLRGRYEVQIETDAAGEKTSHHTGGVYGFLTPQPEQLRRADVWQTYDIILVGRTLTVAQNGVTIIDHQEVPGITGGALNSHEAEPGPIYLQGSEQGTTSFRNIIVTPALK